MKNINRIYSGENSYVAIFENIKQKIDDTTPETGASIDFIDNAKSILSNSHSPLLELTAFCTNDEKVNRNDTTIADVIDYMKKETARGDMNFLINLGKEEHFINKARNGAYDVKGDNIINELKHLFSEPSSVIEAAFRKGLFDSMESDILADMKLNDFKNESDSKRRNKVNTEYATTGWTQLNESVNWGTNQGLHAYNPIGVGIEDDTTGNVCVLMQEYVLRAVDGVGITAASHEIYNQALTPFNRQLLNAINTVPYNVENDTFNLGGDWDFEMQLKTDAAGQQVIEMRDLINPNNTAQIPGEELQQFLFESVESLVKQQPNEDQAKLLQHSLYESADNFMLLVNNYDKLIKLEDYVVVKNPENNVSVLFHKLEGTNSLPEIITTNTSEGIVKFPTYEKMLVSIMEVLQPNEFQGHTLMTYFQDKLNKDIDSANRYRTELDAVNAKVNELSEKISAAEKLKSIANPDSQIFVEQVELLKTLNNEYSKLLVKQTEVAERVAYFAN